MSLPIILASTSPRRISLMNQTCLSIEARSPLTDETPYLNESPKKLVSRLAKEKAESAVEFAVQRYKKSIILAADTIVVSPNGRKILGKPETEAEAKKTLALLSGKKHTVLTGYCLMLATHLKSQNRPIVKVVQSRVKMRKISKQTISLYVASGEPMDKAGSYGAQGLGMTLIESIEGSYTNVVGLPMAQIFSDLEVHFGIKLFSWLEKKEKTHRALSRR